MQTLPSHLSGILRPGFGSFFSGPFVEAETVGVGGELGVCGLGRLPSREL